MKNWKTNWFMTILVEKTFKILWIAIIPIVHLVIYVLNLAVLLPDCLSYSIIQSFMILSRRRLSSNNERMSKIYRDYKMMPDKKQETCIPALKFICKCMHRIHLHIFKRAFIEWCHCVLRQCKFKKSIKILKFIGESCWFINIIQIIVTI